MRSETISLCGGGFHLVLRTQVAPLWGAHSVESAVGHAAGQASLVAVLTTWFRNTFTEEVLVFELRWNRKIMTSFTYKS